MKQLTVTQTMSFLRHMKPPSNRITSPDDEQFTQDRALAKKQRDTRRAIEALLEERRLKALLEM